MNKSIKISCEILLKKAETILLGKRKNCYGEGTWALPGGHLNYGESLLDCAKRELKEELGIEADDFQLITVTETVSADHYIRVSFVVEDFPYDDIKCLEPDRCYEWRFFNINELPENIFESHQPILKKYFANKLY